MQRGRMLVLKLIQRLSLKSEMKTQTSEEKKSDLSVKTQRSEPEDSVLKEKTQKSEYATQSLCLSILLQIIYGEDLDHTRTHGLS